MPEFASVYYNMSQGEGDTRGPWNSDENFEYVTDGAAVMTADGGDGVPHVILADDELTLLQDAAERTRSDPRSNPTTGAELGQVSEPPAGAGPEAAPAKKKIARKA